MMQPIQREPTRLRIPGKTLIVVAEPHGYTHAIASTIALRMRSGGHRVDVSDIHVARGLQPEDYDAVILGTEAGRRRDRHMICDYIASHRAPLQKVPTGLFVVCNSRTSRSDPQHFIESLEDRVGWRARFAAAFSFGAFGRTRYLVRRLLLASLRQIDGSIANRATRELVELADALTNELAKPRR